MNVIVGVSRPLYPTPSTSGQRRAANAACKADLGSHFPSAGIRYHGRLSGDLKVVDIGFLAIMPAEHPTAVALVAAAGGKRPTLGRQFAGAHISTCDANGPVRATEASPAVVATATIEQAESTEPAAADSAEPAAAAWTEEVLGAMTMRDLVQIGAGLGITVNSGGSKGKAARRILQAQDDRSS